jgi:uncharacterized protein (DUF1330 family)
MAAYMIFDIVIHDQQEYDEYKKHTPAAVAAYDGKFLIRGGKTETIEGGWNPERIVVLEFPTMERAREWWSSDLYTKAKVIRQRAATTQMILVDGA